MIRLPHLGAYGEFDKCSPDDLIKGLNHNSILLDMLTALSFTFEASLPVTPSDGQTVILPNNSVYMWLESLSSWVTVPPVAGLTGLLLDDDTMWVFDGSAWIILEGGGGSGGSGLNMIPNPSFEKDAPLTNWVINTGTLERDVTTLLTQSNKFMMRITADAIATLSTTVELPTEMDTMDFTFSGWIGPITEPIQVDLFSGVENTSRVIEPSSKWQFFTLQIQGTLQVEVEFRNTNATTYEIDELFFGPSFGRASFPDTTIVLEGNLNGEGAQIAALIAAFETQFPLLYKMFGPLAPFMAHRVIGTYTETSENVKYDYAWDGTTFAPVDYRRKSFTSDVNYQILNGMEKTSYREFSAATPLSLVYLKPGFTTVVAIKNTAAAPITVTLPSGVIKRSDVVVDIEAGQTNVYTFVNVGGIIYVACVDGMS